MTRYEKSPVRLPRFGWRIVSTLLIIAAFSLLQFAYGAVAGPMEARSAVMQLQDSNEEHAKGHLLATSNVSGFITGMSLLALAGVWIPCIAQIARYQLAKEDETQSGS